MEYSDGDRCSDTACNCRGIATEPMNQVLWDKQVCKLPMS